MPKTKLAKLNLKKQTLSDCFLGFSRKVDHPPVKALTQYLCQQLDKGEIDGARMALGAIYKDHFAAIPVTLRDELQVLSKKLNAGQPPIKKLRQPLAGPMSVKGSYSGGVDPDVAVKSVPRQKRRRPSPKQTKSDSQDEWVERPSYALEPFTRGPAPLQVVVPPVRSAQPGGWLLLAGVVIGLGVARWSEE